MLRERKKVARRKQINSVDHTAGNAGCSALLDHCTQALVVPPTKTRIASTCRRTSDHEKQPVTDYISPQWTADARTSLFTPHNSAGTCATPKPHSSTSTSADTARTSVYKARLKHGILVIGRHAPTIPLSPPFRQCQLSALADKGGVRGDHSCALPARSRRLPDKRNLRRLRSAKQTRPLRRVHGTRGDCRSTCRATDGSIWRPRGTWRPRSSGRWLSGRRDTSCFSRTSGLCGCSRTGGRQCRGIAIDNG